MEERKEGRREPDFKNDLTNQTKSHFCHNGRNQNLLWYNLKSIYIQQLLNAPFENINLINLLFKNRKQNKSYEFFFLSFFFLIRFRPLPPPLRDRNTKITFSSLRIFISILFSLWIVGVKSRGSVHIFGQHNLAINGWNSSPQYQNKR